MAIDLNDTYRMLTTTILMMMMRLRSKLRSYFNREYVDISSRSNRCTVSGEELRPLVMSGHNNDDKDDEKANWSLLGQF